MMTIIREGKESDLPDMHRIDRECFDPQFSYTRKIFKGLLLSSDVFTLVAEEPDSDAGIVKPESEQGKIVGFIIGARNRIIKHGSVGSIVTLDVRPENRRAKIGTRLLREAEKHLNTLGVKQINLEVWEKNTGAIKFYTDNGYEYLGSIPDYYAKYKNALIMRKVVT
jgi:ribosomal protein S18 acetylase RimI-like enzyme